MSVMVVSLAAGGLVLATFTVAASSAEPTAGAVDDGLRCVWVATGHQRAVPVARCTPKAEQFLAGTSAPALEEQQATLRPKVAARPSS